MFKRIAQTAAATAAVCYCTFAAAQVSVPNTFAAGSPARAAEVNANFQALVSAINALGARVTKLEGTVTAADLAGTYAIHQFQTELGAPPQQQRVAVYASNGGATVTLTANGTANVSAVTAQGHQLNFPQNTLTARNSTDAATTTTWSLAGGKVTLFGGELSIADGGRLLIRTSANPADGTNVLLLLIRTN